MNQEHTKFHLSCCFRPMLSFALWLAAVACLVMAWVAVYQRGLVFGLEPLAWYWNALVLGVLSMGKKGYGHGSCGTCMLGKKEGM